MLKICLVATCSLKTLFDNGQLLIRFRPCNCFILYDHILKLFKAWIHLTPHVYMQMDFFPLKLSIYLTNVTITQNNFGTFFWLLPSEIFWAKLDQSHCFMGKLLDNINLQVIAYHIHQPSLQMILYPKNVQFIQNTNFLTLMI